MAHFLVSTDTPGAIVRDVDALHPFGARFYQRAVHLDNHLLEERGRLSFSPCLSIESVLLVCLLNLRFAPSRHRIQHHAAKKRLGKLVLGPPHAKPTWQIALAYVLLIGRLCFRNSKRLLNYLPNRETIT